MKRLIEVAEVAKCGTVGCAYNKEGGCHARAITIGHAHGHLCDTLLRSQDHTHRNETSGVGACRATDCVNNEDYECQADAIEVGLQSGQAQCLTYSEK